jgi:hypothetical protein
MVCPRNKPITRRVALFSFVLCNASILVSAFTTNTVCKWSRLTVSSMSFTHRRFYRPFESANDHEYNTRPLGEQNISRDDIGPWSTKKLLRELDRLNIRYPPTATRSDLESAFLSSNAISMDYLQNDEDICTQNIAGNVKEVSAPYMPAVDERFSAEWKERLMKRSQGRQKLVRESLRSSMPFSQNQVVRKIPRIAGTIFDGVVRKARRLKRQVADFWALDDETGVRDVRYEYVRREAISPPISPVEVEHVDVIVSDASNPLTNQPRILSTIEKSKRRRTRSSADFHVDLDFDFLPSRRFLTAEGSNDRIHGSTFKLPPGSLHDERYNPDDVAPDIRRSHRRRAKDTFRAPIDKKVYNPYGSDKENEKDVVDRVSEFLADTADRVMWGMFDETIDIKVSSESPNSSSYFDNHDMSRVQERSHRRVRPSCKPPRHWKDRMEERLDSMLGLHQDSDFYRSWTERFERVKTGQTENDTSVTTQSRRRTRLHHAAYSKPFWEEEGSIFSLLFGRSNVDIGRRFDDRSGFETGSMLSILQVILRSFLIVASYLCRWASTQGALPQPVVVLGVSSAVLCARPHRRLIVAGIALLLLRTVGEVLHGYVHGADGWENDRDYDSEDDYAGHENDSDGSFWDD